MSSDRRERQKAGRTAAREAKRKAESRKEVWRRVRLGLGIGVSVAVVLLLSGVLSSGGPEVADTYLAFRDLPTACGADAPDSLTPMQFEAPEESPVAGRIEAVIATSCGPITVELDPSISPLSVASFVFLAKEGYYDGTVFHRIASDFVIQGGDQTASGTGNPGYRIANEFPEAGFAYDRGVVAMAKGSGPGTTGSQFFIVTGEDAANLSASFNVLGRVIDGFDALDRITAVPTTRQPNSPENSRPLEAVYVEGISVEG
jgi:cyclophilin family peptidyl-prolyl cis-trans isomerase